MWAKSESKCVPICGQIGLWEIMVYFNNEHPPNFNAVFSQKRLHDKMKYGKTNG